MLPSAPAVHQKSLDPLDFLDRSAAHYAVPLAGGVLCALDARLAVKEASKSGESMREVALGETNLRAEKLNEVRDPALMLEPSADRVGAGANQNRAVHSIPT